MVAVWHGVVWYGVHDVLKCFFGNFYYDYYFRCFWLRFHFIAIVHHHTLSLLNGKEFTRYYLLFVCARRARETRERRRKWVGREHRHV